MVGRPHPGSNDALQSGNGASAHVFGVQHADVPLPFAAQTSGMPHVPQLFEPPHPFGLVPQAFAAHATGLHDPDPDPLPEPWIPDPEPDPPADPDPLTDPEPLTVPEPLVPDPVLEPEMPDPDPGTPLGQTTAQTPSPIGRGQQTGSFIEQSASAAQSFNVPLAQFASRLQVPVSPVRGTTQQALVPHVVGAEQVAPEPVPEDEPEPDVERPACPSVPLSGPPPPVAAENEAVPQWTRAPPATNATSLAACIPSLSFMDVTSALTIAAQGRKRGAARQVNLPRSTAQPTPLTHPIPHPSHSSGMES